MELEAIERCQHGEVESHFASNDDPAWGYTKHRHTNKGECPGGRRIPVTVDYEAVETILEQHTDGAGGWGFDHVAELAVAAALVDPDGKPLETP
jgi:hypothetical protein